MSVTTAVFRPDASRGAPHPLDPLSVDETNAVRQAVLDAHDAGPLIRFRSIFLEEPLKKELTPFLELEHAGELTGNTPWPSRLAKVQYDVVRGAKDVTYVESCVDIQTKKEMRQRVVDKRHQAGLTTYVFTVDFQVTGQQVQSTSLFEFQIVLSIFS